MPGQDETRDILRRIQHDTAVLSTAVAYLAWLGAGAAVAWVVVYVMNW